MSLSKAIMKLMAEVRSLREERHIKQGQFALDIGLNPKHYSELENPNLEHLDIKMSTFLKICLRLRIAPWRLLYRAWHNEFNFEEQDRDKRKGN